MKKKFDFTAEMKEVQVTINNPENDFWRKKNSCWKRTHKGLPI